MAPRETENNTYAKFWGYKQRTLWYIMVFSGVVNTRIRFREKEDPNASDIIAFCEFHSFLVQVQTNAGYMHTMHAMHV